MLAEAKKITTVFFRLPLLIFLCFVSLSAALAETLPIKNYTSADGLIYEGAPPELMRIRACSDLQGLAV